jgi:hypothetical protein
VDQEAKYWRDKWSEAQRTIQMLRDMMDMKGKKKKGKKGC